MKKFQKYLIALLACSFVATSAIGMSSCSLLDLLKGDTSSESVESSESESSEEGSSEESSSDDVSESTSSESSSVPTTHNHVWNDGAITTEATCETDGVETYACTVAGCEETKKEAISRTGHTWIWTTWEDEDSVSYEGDRCETCEQTASQDLEYALAGEAYYVTGVGNCRDAKIYVPTKHEGLDVKGIDGAFRGFGVITRLEVIGDMDTIDENAGAECENLAEVVLNGAVKEIGDNTFVNCESLVNVELGAGLESIGNYSFKGCIALRSVALPSSVSYLGVEAFSDCIALEKVSIGESESGDGNLTSSLSEIGAYAFANCDTLKEIVLGEGIELIGDYAFSGCEGLLEIVVPDSVTEIGEYAFSGCEAVEKISVGRSMDNSKTMTIGAYAFSDCENLKVLTLPKALETISVNVFDGADSLQEVHISDVDAWCRITFEEADSNPLCYGAADLYVNGEKTTDIVISDEAASVCDYAFYNYENMTSLVIGENVTSIGKNAFAGCSNLAKVEYNAICCADLADNAYVFARSGQKAANGIALTVGVKVEYIPAYLFAAAKSTDQRHNLTSLAFAECANGEACEDETHEDSVCLEVGAYAFQNSSELTTVVLGSSVTTIGEYAFANCNSMESIIIPDSISGDSVGAGAFEDCKVKKVVYPAEMIAHLSTSKLEEATITKGDIADEAFRNCDRLVSVVVGDGVTSIGVRAFADSNGLKTVELKGKDLVIAERAFSRCSMLADMNFSENVKEIGDYAFYYCSKITTLDLGDGVEAIGVGAFKYCSKLANLVVGSSVSYIATEAFSSCSALKTVDFEVRTGWSVTAADGTVTEHLWSTNLADPPVAAEYLRKTYCRCVWTRA